ncbi:MAG: hypothetical protein ACPHY8_01180 [Patescibacteria group bacterium]
MENNLGPVLNIYSDEAQLKNSLKISNYLKNTQHQILDFSDYIEFVHNDI